MEAEFDKLVNELITRACAAERNGRPLGPSIVDRLRTFFRQNRAPQPVQKPVAWMRKFDGKLYPTILHTDEIYYADALTDGWTPLYTSPQPVQGGDEGIDEETREALRVAVKSLEHNAHTARYRADNTGSGSDAEELAAYADKQAKAASALSRLASNGGEG